MDQTRSDQSHQPEGVVCVVMAIKILDCSGATRTHLREKAAGTVTKIASSRKPSRSERVVDSVISHTLLLNHFRPSKIAMESTTEAGAAPSTPPIASIAAAPEAGLACEERCRQLEAELEYMSGVMEVMR